MRDTPLRLGIPNASAFIGVAGLIELRQLGPSPQLLELPELLNQLRLGSHLALLPQLARRSDHADELAVVRRGQPRLSPMGRQAGCAEPIRPIRALLFLDLNRLFAACRLQRLLKRAHLVPQARNGAALLGAGLIQAGTSKFIPCQLRIPESPSARRKACRPRFR